MTTFNLKPKKFILFGDSITEFCYFPYPMYPEGIAKTPEFTLGGALTGAYARRLDVIQRGYAGYNSDQALVIYDKILKHESKDAEIVLSTIFFGSNDAVMGNSPQTVPLERYAANMDKMIKQAKARGIKVIAISPALHDNDKWDSLKLSAEDVFSGRYRSSENNRKYADALAKVCEDNSVAFVDLHKEFSKVENWKALLCDGLHFTGKGYEVMYQAIVEAIAKWYPELAPGQLPMILPEWRQVDATFNECVEKQNP